MVIPHHRATTYLLNISRPQSTTGVMESAGVIILCLMVTQLSASMENAALNMGIVAPEQHGVTAMTAQI